MDEDHKDQRDSARLDKEDYMIYGALKRIEEALDDARSTFINYYGLHKDKRTDSGDKKAQANIDKAVIMEQALADCQAIRGAVPEGIPGALEEANFLRRQGGMNQTASKCVEKAAKLLQQITEG